VVRAGGRAVTRPLAWTAFDTIELLLLMDAHHHPITIHELAARTKRSPAAERKRMDRLRQHGLVTRTDAAGWQRTQPTTYQPTHDAITAYHDTLRWIDQHHQSVAPPVQDESVAHASLAVFGLTHYGTEAAA
jgi:predicted ArsR family transcriptional regulator